MSTIAISPAFQTTTLRVSFVGLLRGELRKLAHLRITQALVILYTAAIVFLQLVLATGPNESAHLRADPAGSFYNIMTGDFSIVRIFSGIVCLVLAAHVVGLDYQQGLRVLLARGAGRVRLLSAKALVLALTGAALFVWGCAIELIFGIGIIRAQAGTGAPWSALPSDYWRTTGIYALCVLLSIGVTLLLGIAASVVGRSLAFGLAVGLSWFAVDNMGILALNVTYQLTHQDFWRQLSGYSLGLLLNRLPDYLIANAQVTGFGLEPLVPVSSAHALAVIAGYAVIFAAVAITLTARRDVRE